MNPNWRDEVKRKMFLTSWLIVSIMAFFAFRAEASCEAPFPCSHEPPTAEPTPVLTAQSDAAANAQSASVAVGTGVGTASADSSNTNVNGQSQGQSLNADLSNTNGQAQSVDNAQSQEANNEGVELDADLSVSTTYQQVRQAPSVAQGSFAIQGCGVAGNAGGSSTRGAAFLGVGFTTPECYAFILAQAYEAVGERQAACLVLNSTKAAKRAVRAGVELPICSEGSSHGNYVTPEQLIEHEKRIVRKLLQK